MSIMKSVFAAVIALGLGTAPIAYGQEHIQTLDPEIIAVFKDVPKDQVVELETIIATCYGTSSAVEDLMKKQLTALMDKRMLNSNAEIEISFLSLVQQKLIGQDYVSGLLNSALIYVYNEKAGDVLNVELHNIALGYGRAMIKYKTYPLASIVAETYRADMHSCTDKMKPYNVILDRLAGDNNDSSK